MKKKEQVIYLLPFDTIKSLSFFHSESQEGDSSQGKRWELTLAGCLDVRGEAEGRAKHLYLLELI